MIQKILLNLAKWITTLVPHFSRVGNSVFFSVNQFPWAECLEANWSEIRKELDQVLLYSEVLPNYQDISDRQTQITNDDRWKTFFFYAFGFRSGPNCDRCPKTWALLKDIPGLQVAFFSILAPHKHIPEHTGKYKGVIRYHLALKVPEPADACGIRINNEVVHWEEGKSLLFDDTFPHEAWNQTDDYRVVLFLDIMRPLRFPLSFVNWLISKGIGLSPMIQGAKQKHQSWEQQFEALQRFRA
jgi:ornithine lipid ester-linked acyl 2-hydroxylase